MKRMTCFVMALALVLGLAQCKKEQLIPENEGERVTITLDVTGDNNAKVDVDPPYVTFKSGDEIQVACNGHHVGTLTHDGTKFKGDLTNVTPGQPLYFYFFGNVSPQYFGTNKESCTVYIGEQTGELPVISMGPSIDSDGNIVNYTSGVKAYTARLHNKCSLMKFNVTTPSTAPIFINGMNNFMNIDFTKAANDEEYNGFSYSQVYNGKIEMKGQEGSGQKTYWAIVLPQDYVAEGIAYTEDYSYVGARPAIEGGIGSNQYYSSGVDIEMVSYDPVGTPLTFEAKTAGTTVSLTKYGAIDVQEVEYSTDGNTWQTYRLAPILLTNVGDKVMFRGTNAQYAISLQAYNKFSINKDGACYVYGNIMSLIVANPESSTQLNDEIEYHFACLFQGCEGLYNHPQKPLQLPATTLGSYCYAQMFMGCTHLTRAPELPADELSEHCYEAMFSGCSSLTASPVLWAMDLVPNCYASMFNNCSSLNLVTCLAETGINDAYGTENWMSSVAAVGVFTKAPGITWPRNQSGIPNGWSEEEQ